MTKYLYNGTIFPEVKWDKTNYPYAYVKGYIAYAFSSPLADATNNLFGYRATAKAPFLRSELKLDENNREYWSEWKTVTEDETIALGGYEWSNQDILKSDGSIYLAASEPSLVSYPIVVFDGEATTKSDVPETVIADTLSPVADFLAIGDKVRLTINGVAAEYEVKKVPTSSQSLVGNAGLNGNDSEAEDDGGEWLFATVSQAGAPRMIYFYTRNAGTYQVKIELLADEAAPHDFYITKNGVGQKQDFYLRVGGQSVKLDEYLI